MERGWRRLECVDDDFGIIDVMVLVHEEEQETGLVVQPHRWAPKSHLTKITLVLEEKV